MSGTNCEGGTSSCVALTTRNFPQGETVDVRTCVVHKKKRTKDRAELRKCATVIGSV